MQRLISFFLGVIAATAVFYFSFYKEYSDPLSCYQELDMCQMTLEDPHHCVSICEELDF